MKLNLYFIFIIILFYGCSRDSEVVLEKPKIIFDNMPKTYLLKSDFSSLPEFEDENYDDVLKGFQNNCRTKKAKKIYGSLCEESNNILNAKEFLTSSFAPYMIKTQESETQGLLTGYYEAQLQASLSKTKKYKYPVYETPKDLLIVDLSSIYPDLKNYRLRGKLEGNRIVPYDTRAQSKRKDVEADVICYCDSKIDKFFLEIQGSGRVTLDDNTTMFIGYDNQNGHKYRAIGRYLVEIGALELEDVSLQSIKAWLQNNPKRVDEVLNYNKSLVYFKERNQGATGALGLELKASRSIAIDRRYIPLGSMLYLNAAVDEKEVSRIVFAQDTGGAIKGAVRADLFLGHGDEAMSSAGKLKSDLKLWILMPKNMKEV